MVLIGQFGDALRIMRIAPKPDHRQQRRQRQRRDQTAPARIAPRDLGDSATIAPEIARLDEQIKHARAFRPGCR